jgi:hypothetical protein
MNRDNVQNVLEGRKHQLSRSRFNELYEALATKRDSVALLVQRSHHTVAPMEPNWEQAVAWSLAETCHQGCRLYSVDTGSGVEQATLRNRAYKR